MWRQRCRLRESSANSSNVQFYVNTRNQKTKNNTGIVDGVGHPVTCHHWILTGFPYDPEPPSKSYGSTSPGSTLFFNDDLIVQYPIFTPFTHCSPLLCSFSSVHTGSEHTTTQRPEGDTINPMTTFGGSVCHNSGLCSYSPSNDLKEIFH